MVIVIVLFQHSGYRLCFFMSCFGFFEASGSDLHHHLLTFMVKRHMIVDATIPVPKQGSATNGGMCMFCQRHSREALQSPARSTKVPESGYSSLAQLQFQVHGHMPMNIDIEQLDDGDGYEVTMRRYLGTCSRHKSCGLKFNQTHLDRLLRRYIWKETMEEEKKEKIAQEEERGGSGMRTPSSIEQSFLNEERLNNLS